MSNSIRNFVVGMGYDYDQQGEQRINSGLSSIKSTVLQLGATVAGGYGLKALTTGFADATDKIGKFSQVFGVLPEDIQAIGQALEHEEGSLSSFMSQLEGLENLRAGALGGDVGFLGELGKFGIDGNVILDAENAVEAYKALADQFERVGAQQRIKGAGILGLDAASIRLLSQGGNSLDATIEEEKTVRLLTEDMTKVAADFNDAVQRFGDHSASLTDKLSTSLLPFITDALEGASDLVGSNSDETARDLTALAIGAKLGFSSLFTAPPTGEEGQNLDDVKRDFGNLGSVIRTSLGIGSDEDVANAFNSRFPMNEGSSSRPAPRVQQTNQPIKAEINVMLKGDTIDRQVVDLIGNMNQTTLDDVSNGMID